MAKAFVFLGSLNAFLAVAFGAFGAHALKSKLSAEMFTIWETATQYQMFHAIGIILVGIIARWLNGSLLLNWSGGLFLGGIVIFSGSLYVLSLSEIRAWGAITPLGGLCFLAGWLLLAFVALKSF